MYILQLDWVHQKGTVVQCRVDKILDEIPTYAYKKSGSIVWPTSSNLVDVTTLVWNIASAEVHSEQLAQLMLGLRQS